VRRYGDETRKLLLDGIKLIVRGDATKLPSLHSPFWAPDAGPTIATASEAMTAAALGVLGRR
jgi:hypothetical protein